MGRKKERRLEILANVKNVLDLGSGADYSRTMWEGDDGEKGGEERGKGGVCEDRERRKSFIISIIFKFRYP